MSESPTALGEMLPDGLNGWSTAEDQEYDSDNLFEYINGSAELYISFGFDRVLSRTYVRTDQPDIIVDLFDMKTSQNAFGIFSHSREAGDDEAGERYQYMEGLLLFWKDRYFISILANPETAESKQAVFDIAGQIDAVISTEGSPPDIITLLPEPSLMKESVRYFHHHVWLNSHYYVADENILHIDETTEALLAKYDTGGNVHVLLLVKYPEDGRAMWAYNSFVKHYLPELSERTVVRIEDGTYTGCRRAGDLIVIVFNAPAEKTAIQLIDAVTSKTGEGRKQ